MTVSRLLLVLLSSLIFSESFNLPSIPLSREGVDKYLFDISKMWNEYYDGDNIVNTFNKIFDKNIIICAHKDVCTVGIDAALSNLQQFQSYFKSGWITTIHSSVKLISFDTNSISFEQHGTFTTSFPIPSLSGFNNYDFTVSQHSINIFDEKTGKIIMMDNIYDDDDNEQSSLSPFTQFRGALFRLFPAFKTKQKAQYEVNVLNGLIDANKQSLPTDNKLIFGFINQDVFILLSGFAAIFVFMVITMYFCYWVCCRGIGGIMKYQYVKDTDDSEQDSTDTEN